jgi:hypothetical protein
MDESRYLYRVDFRCDGVFNRGVFYASAEDVALSFCLHYTGIERFSAQPEWQFTIYQVLMDDLKTSQEVLVGIFNQDGYVDPMPEVDVHALKSQIQQLAEWNGRTIH